MMSHNQKENIMRYCLFVLVLLIFACGYPKPENNLALVEENGLSSAEKAMGWESLFDGKSDCVK